MYGEGIARSTTESTQPLDSLPVPGRGQPQQLLRPPQQLRHQPLVPLLLHPGGHPPHKRFITSVFRNEEYFALMEQVAPIVIKTVIAGLPTMQSSSESASYSTRGGSSTVGEQSGPSLNTEPFAYKLRAQLVRNILEMTTNECHFSLRASSGPG